MRILNSLLVYPILWVLFVTADFALFCAFTGNFSPEIGNTLTNFFFFAAFFLVKTVPIMGVVGSVHLAVFHFLKRKRMSELLPLSVKIGAVIGAVTALGAIYEIAIIPSIWNRIGLFGVPIFLTSLLGGYAIGKLTPPEL